MRYAVGLVLAMATVVSPLGVSAQETPTAQGTQLALGTSVEDGALSIQSEAFVKSAPTLEETNVEVRRTRTGVAVSTIAIAGGLAMVFVSAVDYAFQCFLICDPVPRRAPVLMGVGVVTTVGGIAGLGFSARRLRHAKRKQRSDEADQRQVRRVQFDPHASRFVF